MGSNPAFSRPFLDHPRFVGKSYLQHQRKTFGFGSSLLLAGLACFVHGIVPALFVHTGSNAAARLYDRMVINRSTQDDGHWLPTKT